MESVEVLPGIAPGPGCDQEPIHIPGSIQPFGTLLVLDPAERVVRHAAANASRVFARGLDEVLGRGLVDLFGEEVGASLLAALDDPSLEKNPRGLAAARLGDQTWRVVAHRMDGRAILELEPLHPALPLDAIGTDPLLRGFLARLSSVESMRDLAAMAAEEARRRTGFDRVLVYRFDADGHGTVIAEDRNDRLPSYLGLRFPATDIPAQARRLYETQKIRVIPDVDYAPVPIVPGRHPETGAPIDLSHATLRSVSPVHLAYMRNMGTASSMSISILRGQTLWGLISLHHRDPLLPSYEVRAACEVLGQIISAYLEVREHNEEFADRMRLKSLEARLLRFMAEEEFFLDGLRRHGPELLEFAGASGAAVVVQDEVTLVGHTPGERWVRRMVERLAEEPGADQFVTDALSEAWPETREIRDVASGLMAIAVSRLHRSYVLWFRPELVRTVEWAGDPNKPVEEAGGLRPRASFETWKEIVRDRSAPWTEAERTAASELRAAIVDIVLGKAEELAQMSEELARSNKELEAFSYSVSHDLRAPLRHVVGFAELLRGELGPGASPTSSRYLDTIIDSARFAGTLVDSLLNFSQVGRTRIVPVTVNLQALVEEIRRDVMSEAAGRDVRWSIGPLPTVRGDLMMLRLALRNLLSNAVKFTKTRPVAEIAVESRTDGVEHVLSVRDNGVGFEMAYVEKLFGVFQRLHRMEDFEGTGIGLANVRRIAERHGGRAWAEGALDVGATFSFSLPVEAR